MAVIIVVLVILIFGEALLNWAEEFLSVPIVTESNAFAFRWLIGFLVLVLVFTLIYCAVPTKNQDL